MLDIKNVVSPHDLSDVYFDKGNNTALKIEYKFSYNIATLRTAVNIPNVVFVTDSGQQGMFQYDSTDTTSTDDGTTVIVNGTKRYKKVSSNNASDAFLLARVNHTGTQAISTVTGLQTTLDTKQANLTGTGFVKSNNGTISYDNTSYLPLTGGSLTGSLSTTGNITITGSPSNTIQGGNFIYLNGGTGTSFSTIQQGIGKFDIWGFDGNSWINNLSINNSNGNVGIGTNLPTERLEVNGGVKLKNGTNPYLSFDNGTNVSYIQVASSIFDFNTPNAMTFNIGGSEKMRLTQTGNVGIGLTNPSEQLEISNSIAGGTGGRLSITNSANQANGNISDIGFKVNSNFTSGYFSAMIRAFQQNSSNNSDLAFYTYNGTGSAMGTEKMRILANGNVGIGTTTPAYSLDVLGNIHTTGSYKLNGVSLAYPSNGSNTINGRVVNNSSGTDGMYVGYGNGSNGITRVFDGGTSNNLSLSSGQFATTGFTKHLFGTQTDDGTFAQFAGDVKMKSSLTVNGVLRLNENVGMTNNSFQYWKDLGSTDRRILGVSSNTIYLGDVDNTILSSNIICRANIEQAWDINGSRKMTLTETGLGIGVSIPWSKVHVGNSTNINTYVTVGNPLGGTIIGHGADNEGIITGYVATNLKFGYNGSTTFVETMRLNADGKLHLGGVGTNKFNIFDDNNDLGQLTIGGKTSTGKNLILGYNTVGDYGIIQAVFQSVSYSNLVLNRDGGNVGIGTTTPTSKLQVVGLPVYADNTSAIAGGLTAGAFYRTSTGVLMVAF